MKTEEDLGVNDLVIIRHEAAPIDDFPYSAKIRGTETGHYEGLIAYGDTKAEAVEALLEKIKHLIAFRSQVLHLAKKEGI